MSLLQVVAFVHVLATGAMTGLCWFVQVVHYPMFAAVGGEQFVGYQGEHVRRTNWIVAPLMLAELASAIALFVMDDQRIPRSWTHAGLMLLAVVWISTFALQVPAHRVLERGFDAATHGRLVRSNWIRTLAWSLRAVLAIAMAGAIACAHS